MTRVFLNLFGNGFYAANKRQRDGAEPNFRPVLKVMTNDLLHWRPGPKTHRCH
jgi:hypothetical protein